MIVANNCGIFNVSNHTLRFNAQSLNFVKSNFRFHIYVFHFVPVLLNGINYGIIDSICIPVIMDSEHRWQIE